jgi:hypothetical protein
MREAIGEDIEPRLRGMLQGHAEAAMATTDSSPAPSVTKTRRVTPR